MDSDRAQRYVDRLLDEAEAAIPDLNWEVVRDRARAALAFEAAAERALGPGVVGSALEERAPNESSQPLPVFFKEGRSVVKKLLGERAHKRVYLVHDTLLDRDVAYGLIKHEGLGDVGHERILREARAMASLSDHSNVVRLHDFGEESGQPYMVLPLMISGDVGKSAEERA